MDRITAMPIVDSRAIQIEINGIPKSQIRNVWQFMLGHGF